MTRHLGRADGAGDIAGVVLTGGQSSRMGVNKAIMDIDGEPMAFRTARVVAAAGCTPIWFQGGDPEELAALTSAGDVVSDQQPGQGPVGAIVSALAAARQRAPEASSLLVAACDLIDLDVDAVRLVIEASDDAAIAVAVDAVAPTRPALLSCWPTSFADVAATAAASGATSYHRLLDTLADAHGMSLKVVEVPPSSIRNANRPADVVGRRSNGDLTQKPR